MSPRALFSWVPKVCHKKLGVSARALHDFCDRRSFLFGLLALLKGASYSFYVIQSKTKNAFGPGVTYNSSVILKIR